MWCLGPRTGMTWNLLDERTRKAARFHPSACGSHPVTYFVLAVERIDQGSNPGNDIVVVHEMVHFLAQIVHSINGFRRSYIRPGGQQAA